MKIAIQGHPTRGKEVIQTLESLGGINRMNHSGCFPKYFYYISSGVNTITCTSVRPKHFSIYTLEEFEKEFLFKIGDEVIFPVKIGWASGKITGLTYRENKLKYEVDVRTSGYHYVEPHKLSLYTMKEERNITLTLDKAKEWYKKGGELKEVALQAYSEEELTKIAFPKTWEEFCDNYPVKESEAMIDYNANIVGCNSIEGRRCYRFKDIMPSKKSAEAHLAMMQLEQLRDCWRQDWKPTPGDTNYVIKFGFNGLDIYCFCTVEFLSFPTKKMAEEFLKCFRDLIEKAGDLI